MTHSLMWLKRYALPVFSVVVFIVCLLAMLTARDVRVMNSDTLFIPARIRDVMQWGGKPLEWVNSAATFYIPDIALQYLLTALGLGVSQAMLVVSIVLFVLLTIGWVIVAYITLPPSPARHYLCFIPVIPVALIFNLYDATSPVMFLSIPIGSHFGYMVVSLYVYAISQRLTQSQRLTRRMAITLVATLMLISAGLMASNSLFLVQVLAPMLALALVAWALLRMTPRRLALPVLPVVIGVILGFIFFRATSVNQSFDRYVSAINEATILNSINAFATWIQRLLLNQPLAATLFFGSLLYHMVYCAIVLRRIILRQPVPASIALISGVAVLSPLFSMASMVATGTFLDEGTLRYFMPLFWLPLPALSIHLAYLLKHPMGARVMLALQVALLAMVAPVLPRISNLSRYSDYYPPLQACLDRELSARGLQNGLGHYWDANYLTMTTRNYFHILPLLGDLRPYIWLVNPQWYRRFPAQFIVYDPRAPAGFQMKEADIVKAYGSPADRFECPGRSVLVYNRPGDQLSARLLPYIGDAP